MDISYSTQLWELPVVERNWWKQYVKGKDGMSVDFPKDRGLMTVITASSQEQLDAALKEFDEKYPSMYSGMNRAVGGP
jgi:hypothetical protein